MITNPKIGETVRVKPTAQLAGSCCIVKRVRSSPAAPLEIEVEFTGPEWFYPARTWFKANELEPAT